MAGIVSTVADDDERLLVQMPVLQMKETLANRIVERGSSPRGDGCKCFLKIPGIVRKCLPSHEFNRNVIVEIHDEHFILGIAQMYEGIHRGNDIRELGAHTSAVVNDEPHANGCVSLIEYRQLLQLSIFKHTKVFQLKARDKCSARVSHIDGKQDKTGVHCNFRLALPASGARRRERRIETENAQQNHEWRKEQESLAWILAAPAWIEDHDEAFSRRGT